MTRPEITHLATSVPVHGMAGFVSKKKKKKSFWEKSWVYDGNEVNMGWF